MKKKCAHTQHTRNAINNNHTNGSALEFCKGTPIVDNNNQYIEMDRMCNVRSSTDLRYHTNVGRSKRKTRRKATKYNHLRVRMNHFFCIWLYGSVLSAGLLACTGHRCVFILHIFVYIIRIDVAHGAIRLITMMKLLTVHTQTLATEPYRLSASD